jgi:GntR family transcriptional regulator
MDFRNQKAIYLQIADFVCEQILLNKWKEKDKIPSIRELAISLEVNPNTVMRTYSFLEEQEIIAMQRGIGYFVAEKATKHALRFKKEEFLSEDLPQLFKSMDLLDIGLDDFKQLYQRRSKHEKEQ